MKRLLRLGWLVLLPAVAGAVEIEVGSTRIEIPAPDGYLLLTDEMQPYADLMRRFVPSQNLQHAVFLGEEDAALAAAGQVPQPKRFFYVQSLRDLAYRPIKARDFAELKRSMKSENDRTLKEIEEKAPGMIREISDGIAKDYDVDLALSLHSAVPFPPHFESDRTLAFSMITKYGMSGQGGSPESFEMSATVTVVHLKAKIVFLYAAGRKEDIEWTRTASREWVERIVAANPSTGETAAQERGNINWAALAGMFVAVALVAGFTIARVFGFARRAAHCDSGQEGK